MLDLRKLEGQTIAFCLKTGSHASQDLTEVTLPLPFQAPSGCYGASVRMFLWRLSWQRPGLPVATQKWRATWPSLRGSRAWSKVRLGVVMAYEPSGPHSLQGTEYTAGTAGGQRHGEVVAWRHGCAAGPGSLAAVSYLISASQSPERIHTVPLHPAPLPL